MCFSRSHRVSITELSQFVRLGLERGFARQCDTLVGPWTLLVADAQGMDTLHKTMLLGTSFLMDYMYFEQENN